MNMNRYLRIDHLVITTTQLEDCLSFYQTLGFQTVCFEERGEIHAGTFKINVHVKGRELTPYAKQVTCGSQDVCIEINEDIYAFKEEMENKGIQFHTEVVERYGKNGEMHSIYLYDLDGNLLEFCKYK